MTFFQQKTHKSGFFIGKIPHGRGGWLCSRVSRGSHRIFGPAILFFLVFLCFFGTSFCLARDFPSLLQARENYMKTRAINAAKVFLTQEGQVVKNKRIVIDEAGWDRFCIKNIEFCQDHVAPKVKDRAFWAVLVSPKAKNILGGCYWVLVDRKDFSVLHWMVWQ